MNGKKAKLIRRAARDVAIATTLPAESSYLESHGKRNNGVVYLAKCERVVLKKLKSMHTKGIPAKTFDDMATNAIVG